MSQDFYAVFKQRDGVTVERTDHLTVVVGPYSCEANGGPAQAEHTIYGSELDLWALVNWLAYRVENWYARRYQVWWGKVVEVELTTPSQGLVRSWSIVDDEFANRVQVVYTDTHGRQKKTAWIQDDDSVTRYGKRELIISSDVATSAAAASQQATIELAKRKAPAKHIQASGDTEAKVKLTCWGEFALLDQQIYIQLKGDESYLQEKDLRYQAFGFTTVTYVAQKIRLLDTQAFYLEELSVRLAKYPGTTDSVIFELCADDGNGGGAGLPGTVLDTCTILAADVADFSSFDYVNGLWATHYQIQPATNYWLRARKNGANSSLYQYYWAGSKRLGYPRGVALLYRADTSNWRYMFVGTPAAYNAGHETTAATATTGNNYDCCFRLIGGWTIQTQVEQLIAASQWLTVSFEATATARSYPERTGGNSIKEELEKMLMVGDDSSHRLLARVDASRIMHIIAEPAQTAYAWQLKHDPMTGNLVLLDAYGQRLPWAVCPSGGWISLPDSPPPGVQLGALEGSRQLFVERCTVDPGRPDEPQLEFRGATSRYSLITL